MIDDYYAILGVPRSATQSEIKTRYRFLAQAYHPDKFGTDAHKQAAEEEFKRINEAHEILSNPSQRARYDESRARSSPPPQHEKSPPRRTHSSQPTSKPSPAIAPLAKWSLGLGIVGLLGGLLSIAAIICGHRALIAIDTSHGTLTGRSHAMAGLTLGYIRVTIAIIIFIWSLSH